jgi:hypothetical protein
VKVPGVATKTPTTAPTTIPVIGTRPVKMTQERMTKKRAVSTEERPLKTDAAKKFAERNEYWSAKVAKKVARLREAAAAR